MPKLSRVSIDVETDPSSFRCGGDIFPGPHVGNSVVNEMHYRNLALEMELQKANQERQLLETRLSSLAGLTSNMKVAVCSEPEAECAGRTIPLGLTRRKKSSGSASDLRPVCDKTPPASSSVLPSSL